MKSNDVKKILTYIFTKQKATIESVQNILLRMLTFNLH